VCNGFSFGDAEYRSSIYSSLKPMGFCVGEETAGCAVINETVKRTIETRMEERIFVMVLGIMIRENGELKEGVVKTFRV